MIKITGIIIAQVAICASILSLYFTLLPLSVDRPLWHWGLIAFAVVACFLLAIREIANYWRFAPKICRSTKKINSYMLKWISSGGRVMIFSRDMSWAHDEAIRLLLMEKANRNELTICLEHQIPLTDELCQQGAQIVTYEALDYVPNSRFTIVDFERDGARVAVGVKFGDDHVIQEFRSGSHPFFAVAEDLVKFLISSNKNTPNVPQD